MLAQHLHGPVVRFRFLVDATFSSTALVHYGIVRSRAMRCVYRRSCTDPDLFFLQELPTVLLVVLHLLRDPRISLALGIVFFFSFVIQSGAGLHTIHPSL